MNWLSDFVRPRIKALIGEGGRDIPDNLWYKCEGCDQMIFHREYVQNLRVCPFCQHHGRVNARERLEQLFDPSSFSILKQVDAPLDPLKFKDTKKYTERMKEYRHKTGLQDVLLVGEGTIEGMPLVIACMDFGFMGGSMGQAMGLGFMQGIQHAVSQNLPFLIITASGGARMQEGILALMQMPRTVAAIELLRRARLPYLVLLSNPTTGGVAASFAMLGDIQLAEPGATIGFAGARVIQETIRGKLPDGFQQAEYLFEHGMVDLVVSRSELRSTLRKILRILSSPPPLNRLTLSSRNA